MEVIQIIRLSAIAKINEANAASFVAALQERGAALGLAEPHRFAQLLAQLQHEGADFRYDREIWGPTEAQKRYDTRTDLGNTAALDGDGKLYMGRTAIQITGKANYAAFRDWCREQGLAPPDFVAQPDKVNTDPWEGLGPLWYWDTRRLNRYADDGNAEMITRRINGGLNGYADRLDRLTRVSLVLLGYGPTEIRAFQRAQGLAVDGAVGAKTREAMHAALKQLAPLSFVAAAPARQSEPAPAPVPDTAAASSLLAQFLAAVAAFFRRSS